VQLLNDDGMIVSTNVKDGRTYFGFKCIIPENGIYTLKVLDFRAGQMVHHVTRQGNLTNIVATFNIQQKNGRRQVQLQRGVVYSFAIWEYSAKKPGVLTLYKDQKRLANNINNAGEIEPGFMYRCLKTGTYIIDLQAENGSTRISVETWNK